MSFSVVKACAALAAVVSLIGCRSASRPQKGFGQLPPTPVTVATAEQRNIPIQVREIGSVEPIAVIAVKAQIGGELTKVFFKEGQEVTKGQQLFEIDPRPYQQALDQAKAALDKDTALVAQAEANLSRDRIQAGNAKEQAERFGALAKEGVISKDQSDTYQTTYHAQDEAVRADEAALKSARAAVIADQAAIETAKLNLSYCYISSPINGRAGALLVQAGNLVKANDTNALVNINQLEPVYVTFSVPEELLPQIRSENAARALPVSASVTAPDGAVRAVTGQLSFIDNIVDNTTGTIKLKGTFPNKDRVLWPGQFVNVTMVLRTMRGATVIPSEAVQSGQKGQIVFVVKQDQTVEPRVVKVGQNVNNQIVIDSGVSPGERVVTDGQLRLFPGAHVQIVPPVKDISSGLP